MPLRGPDHPTAWLAALEQGRPDAVKALDGGLPWGGAAPAMLPFWGDGRGPMLVGSGLLPSAKADYAAKAGRLDKNAIVSIALGWTVKQFVRARLRLTRDDGDGGDDPVGDHPFLDFMKRPSPYYPARTLWSATVIAYGLTGNAYWYKVPSKGGGIAGLRWLSPWMTSPAVEQSATTDTYIKGYHYKVGHDEPWFIPKEQIVHFRDGLNLDDERTGWKKLEAVLTSVVGVNEGMVYTAAILQNMGITPAIITGTNGEALEPQHITHIERTLNGGAGGENRGRIVGLGLPVEVHEMGATPQGMALESILDRPISFICATLGIDPLVLGLSADRGTYENVGQARQMAWEDGIQPMQQAFAEDIREQLLPDFDADESLCVSWDYSKVPALQEDADAKVNRAVVAYQGGLCSLGTAQGLAGLPVTDDDDAVWFASPHQGDPTEEPDDIDDGADIDPTADDPESEGEDGDGPFPGPPSRSASRGTRTADGPRTRAGRDGRGDAA